MEKQLMGIMRRFALTVVVVMSVVVMGVAGERTIMRSELPPEVEKAVAAQSKGATIRGFSEEKKENGQTYYEAELTVSGHSRDVLIDGSGVIVEVEEDIAMDALPHEVRAGLQAKAGKGKVLKVESITKHNKLVAYEAQVMGNG